MSESTGLDRAVNRRRGQKMCRTALGNLPMVPDCLGATIFAGMDLAEIKEQCLALASDDRTIREAARVKLSQCRPFTAVVRKLAILTFDFDEVAADIATGMPGISARLVEQELARGELP